MSPEPKYRPLLMSPPMVRATLRDIDPKTQTRRTKGLEHINDNPGQWKVIRPLKEYEPVTDGGPDQHFPGWDASAWLALKNPAGIEDMGYMILGCPFGVVGDFIYVRETFYAFGHWTLQFDETKGRDVWTFQDWTLRQGFNYHFPDNPPNHIVAKRSTDWGWYKRPSLFMPRAAARITLEITGIRAERLQDISDADAVAEGIETVVGPDGLVYYANYGDDNADTCLSPIDSYRTLWNHINGFGAWALTPWVWVLDFKKL